MGCTNCNGITLFRGEDGIGISGIAWTSNSGGSPQFTEGTTDTYTVTYTDATTDTFGVYNGADGTDGVYGGYSSKWLFDNGTGSGTSTGDFRFDNATLSSVTGIYINETNADATDLTAFISGMNNSGNYGLIRISKETDSNVFWMGIITATSDSGSEWDITLTHVASNGTFVNNDPCVVSYVLNGADGTNGADATDLYDSDWVTIGAHNGTFGLPAFTNWTSPKLRVIGHQVYITGRFLIPLSTKGAPTSLITDTTLYPSTYNGETQVYTGTAGGFAIDVTGSLTSIDSIVPADLQPTQNVLIAQQQITTRAIQDGTNGYNLQLTSVLPTLEFNTSGQLYLNTWKDYLDSAGALSDINNSPIRMLIMDVIAASNAIDFKNYEQSYGAGFTTFEILDSGAGGYVNGTHTGVTSTSISGVGTGAIFTVVIANNQIVSISATATGSGYVDGEVVQLDDTSGAPGIGTGTVKANILTTVTANTDNRATTVSAATYPTNFDGMEPSNLGGFLLPFELSYPIDPSLTEAQITAAIASM